MGPQRDDKGLNKEDVRAGGGLNAKAVQGASKPPNEWITHSGRNAILPGQAAPSADPLSAILRALKSYGANGVMLMLIWLLNIFIIR